MGQIIPLPVRPQPRRDSTENDPWSDWQTVQDRLKAIADELAAFSAGLDQAIADARASLADHDQALACYRPDGSVDPAAYAAYVAGRRRRA